MQVGRSTEACGELLVDMEPSVYKGRLVKVLMALSEAEKETTNIAASSKKKVVIRSFKEKQAIDEFEDYNRQKRKEYASAKTKRRLFKKNRNTSDTSVKRMRRSLNFEPLISDIETDENIMKHGSGKVCRKERRSVEYERSKKIQRKDPENSTGDRNPKTYSSSSAGSIAPNTIRKRKKLQKFAII